MTTRQLALVLASSAACCLSPADAQEARSVALVGSLQSELGCPGDWQPECRATELTFDGEAWRGAFEVPAGDWEYKVALNDGWDVSYGVGGENVPLSLSEAARVTFVFDPETETVTDDAPIAQPGSVTIAGSFQSELGCPGDWQPGCAATGLTFDAEDQVWQGTFSVPAGSWEYKAPLNGSWDENYGADAEAGGANIPLELSERSDVSFYFERGTNWVADDVNDVIVTAAGSFQSELGCEGDWQPWCLRSWMQDPDGDGTYVFSTSALPAGDYEVKAAIGEAWDESYGGPGGANLGFTVPEDGDLVVLSFDASTKVLSVSGDLPKGDLGLARAYWLDEDSFAWDVPATSTVSLHASPTGELRITEEGVSGGTALPLSATGTVSGALAEQWPHLAGLPTWRLNANRAEVADLLRGQVALGAVGSDGPVDATGLQIAGVLDDLYANDAPLGVTHDGEAPTLSVWAPTARSVALELGEDGTLVPMTRDDATGVWSVTGTPAWNRQTYRYRVEVFARETGEVETNLVTDPYSVGLTTNGERSIILDLSDDDLKPEGWDRLRKPALAAPEDAAIYELHVRDFSATDETVPRDLRGEFGAFALEDTDGVKHLEDLAEAGLTHVHLLPAFDCATIPEDPADREEPGDLSGYAPDSPTPQELIEAFRGRDAFNWCYDPAHYTVPEGSYASTAEGTARIVEFREMVEGLADSGLLTVMDVVYNHTSRSGQNEGSVLDRIVPDYYHRLNAEGFIETSSCCANTATEHAMMERLMIDSLVTWVREYKVDGFRFDLMGHHSRQNILNAKQALRSLTLEEDGVDGSSIYLYGEGWNFGEVANDARFIQATQTNMGEGTGVGTFNDRIRDAVRGGGPFDTGEDHVRRQGFASGLHTDPNALTAGASWTRDELLRLSDWVRIGLAGSIEDYRFEASDGQVVRAGDVAYLGQGGAGYTSDPQEAINYVAAHDNETLFDALAYKLPLDTAPIDRARMQNVATSTVLLAQGVPLLHAGQDILRSKSMDRNSYDSGDWFNEVDWSLSENGFAKGLPPERENGPSWDEIAPRLRDQRLRVGSDEIELAAEHVREMLEIRNSSPLFRLRTGDEVKENVHFLNTGPDQDPGVIVMGLGPDADQPEIVVIFNATPDTAIFKMADTRRYGLHPVQRSGADKRLRRARAGTTGFAVPARSTAVFVSGPDGERGRRRR